MRSSLGTMCGGPVDGDGRPVAFSAVVMVSATLVTWPLPRLKRLNAVVL